MNLLLTSSGRRGYLVKFFKEVMHDGDQLHAANSSANSVALKFADRAVITPLISHPDYIPFLKSYCQENSIDAIISLFDIDLPILAKHKQEFADINVQVIVSNEEVINICNDKWATYNFLRRSNFHTPKTYLSLNEAFAAIAQKQVEYPLIVKPRWGMGSLGVFEADNDCELEIFYQKALKIVMQSYLNIESQQQVDRCIVIQEKLTGQEYNLDIMNDLKGNFMSSVVKKKLAMRAGETDYAEIVANKDLAEMGEAISRKLRHIGNLDMDAFLVGDVPHILEMNARFGGGYPFSHLAGVNLPQAIICWLKGEKVDIEILQAEVGVVGQKSIEVVKL